MSEQIIDSLKEWFEKEWLYERHLTAELIKDKDAFQKGCKSFDDKNYSFDGELKIILRKEAGLAEVARVNKNLEKYATHCFRQVEKILSEFINVNPGIEIIAKYLLNKKDFINDPTPIRSLNNSATRNLGHLTSKYSVKKELNPYCLILKINSIQLKNGKCRRLSTSAIKLNQGEENRIFKSIMYFKTFGTSNNLTENAKKISNLPSLNAFEHMYFFRNINSHLNSKEKPFTQPEAQNEAEKYRIQHFYLDPMKVLNCDNETPGFYQRYVDMVLFLYSEYLKNPKLV